MRRPVLAITMGDYNGIGPEVILKSLQKSGRSRFTPLLIGHREVFEYYLRHLGIPLTLTPLSGPDNIRSTTISGEEIPILEITDSAHPVMEPGNPGPHTGESAMKSVSMGVDLCLAGHADALVTAPISKEAISQAGYPFPGHTEYLAERCNTSHVQMILVNGSLRVALATIHVPLSAVASLITPDRIERELLMLDRSLREDFGIGKPKIALLGLNPHAGDGGVIGREEIEAMRPGMEAAARRGVYASGPMPADGFFGSGQWKRYDAILAAYHDQGLIPFKTLSFGNGVNFTAGLPIIRTSPDHGTGFDIAGSGTASESSFSSACELAVTMASRREGRR